jgi:alanine-glyoxylate transaminase/serine-glyoxylate transaminase/serine-pyruvate transaminase
MSEPFKKVMNDISDTRTQHPPVRRTFTGAARSEQLDPSLAPTCPPPCARHRVDARRVCRLPAVKDVYQAESCVLIPGSGSYAMEAVARQFAPRGKSLVIRNGFFSFRWTQIFEGDQQEHIVMRAEPVNPGAPTNELQYAPHDIDKVVDTILKEKPATVFAPQVETAVGMILPDEYIKRVADAVHSVGGLMVLDCIAAGTVWVDMKALGVDALITAPQKGWTGPSCAGIVMLSERGTEVTRATKSNSFTLDLRKWLELMDSYEAGGFMYHATMPTDALTKFRDVMLETKEYGFDKVRDQAWELGKLVREMMAEKGLVSVAAEGYEAPGVVVVHHGDAAVAGKFVAAGTQIAAGVPFMIGEPEDTKTFRIGLFGLDKLKDPAKTASLLKPALDSAVPTDGAAMAA